MSPVTASVCFRQPGRFHCLEITSRPVDLIRAGGGGPSCRNKMPRLAGDASRGGGLVPLGRVGTVTERHTSKSVPRN